MANFRDDLNAYGAKNDPAMARPTNANQYADLPNPQRANEIVTEARRRLAEMGGKPSQLQTMISRVSDEFAQRDAMQQGSDGSSSYQQPNNIDSYIDKVLQMSGMTAPASSAQAAGTEMSGAPVDDVERGGPLPDAEPNPDNDSVDEQGNPSNWQEYAAWAAAGGTAYAAYKFLQKYGRQPTQADIGKVDGASVEGASDRVAVAHGDAPRSAVDESIDAIDGANPKQARLPAPQQQIEGPRAALPAPESNSPIDQSITDTMVQDEIEGRTPSTRVTDAPAQSADPIEEIIRRWQSGDVDGAVRMTQESGVDLNSLRERLRTIVGDSAGKAARRAVR